jgi:NADP-reducing hydrogenase subunit HndB
MKIESTADLENIRQEYSNKLYYPDGTKVLFGMASCGIAAGAKAAFEKAQQNFPQGNGIQISQTGCLGFCEAEPLIEIVQTGKPRVIYQNITEEKIVEVIHSYLENDFKKTK